MMANPNPAALVNQPPPSVTRKSITGFVTKLVGDGATYGFINDEIFFQQTNVADGPANVNDRVFADCEYSAHLPIKWNATSIKIVARASSAAGTTVHQAPTGILESDPRRQSRQGMMLSQQQKQQQQQPQPMSTPSQQPQAHFSVANQQQQLPQQQQQPQAIAPIANTYQQHRQQKQQQQQQQQLLPNQHDMLQPGMGTIDASNLNQGTEFFAPFGQPPPSMTVQPGLATFDTPMGPPKLEYTSQLGSAFVQNQFMAAPLLPQQAAAAPLLPQTRPQQQQQQQQQQQHHQHHNNQQHNNSNNNTNANKRDQHRNQHNKDGGFNNDKNDRNNRGRNRNENKFDQNRSGNDRDNSNNRSSRAGSGSRDRSGGRSNDDKNSTGRDGTKREGIVKRPSPARNTARSTNSVSSDRSNSKTSSKRHYDPHNIPRTAILTNMNAWNMRSRCPSSIHVPSDLKNIIVNPFLRLDIKNLPKPLNYKIDSADQETDEQTKKETDSGVVEASVTAGEEASKPSSASDANDESQQSTTRKDTDNTPPSSKSDVRLNHKYGIKVVLISLPELEEIYKKVFGEDLDTALSGKQDNRQQAKLDEAVSLLCNTGSNGGHSLIGGKFDPVADGFVEGESNEYERHGRQPDLIATCRRVVAEQTGLDLGPCQSWTLVSTFIYNNKTDYFSSKASIEYSYIYMPNIWSMASPDQATIKQEDEESVIVNPADAPSKGDEAEDVSMKVEQEEGEQVAATATENDDLEEAAAAVESAPGSEGIAAEASELPENLSNLKVVELKARLDEKGIAYKPNAKKADLLLALATVVQAPQLDAAAAAAVAPAEGDGDQTASAAATDPQDQLEEGEVVASGTTTPTDDMENTSDGIDGEVGGEKRKAEDESSVEQQDSKRIKVEGGEEISAPAHGASEKNDEDKKGDKVELVKEPFVVRALKGQQKLSVVTLADVVQVSRYDQFELSVVSNILKEALVKHLSEYMFTALVEDHRQRNSGTANNQGSSESGSISSGTNSQETNSDSNNNNNKLISSKNLQQTSDATSTAATKDHPLKRYINLAFSYFDSTHMGYLHADDLSKLFCNTGLTTSKRALMSLVNENEKFNYRTLADLSPKLDPSYVYRFPDQFQRLPGGVNSSPCEADGAVPTGQQASRMVEFEGVKYDVETLVQQVREAEVRRVNTAERFNHAIKNFDKQADEIQTLEASQKSLQLSIKALNEELGELKRERDLAEKKFENLKTKLEEMLVEVKRK